MSREELIKAVKVKLEEISPFDEPTSFIADGDSDYDKVKPILSYIDESLDEAAHNCLRALPITLLHADIEHTNPSLTIDNDGVAVFSIAPNTRFVRFRHTDLKRDITAFITSEDPLYLLQQNKYTRGGLAKPVAVVSSDHDGTSAGKMEIYSVSPNSVNTSGHLLSINLDKHAEDNSHAAYVVYGGDKYYYQSAALTYDSWVKDSGGIIYTEASSTGNSREVYTAPNSSADTGDTTTSYVAAFNDTAGVKSPIHELIILECAAMVAEILGDVNTATLCRNQQKEKIEAQLK